MSNVHLSRQGFLTKSALPSISRTFSSGGINAGFLVIGDGTNGSTTINDTSVNAWPITRTVSSGGQPIISTTTAPTGMSSSIYFGPAGSVGRLITGTVSGISPGAGNYTFEGWIYLLSSNTPEKAVWRVTCSGTPSLYIFSLVNNKMFVYDNSAGTICTQATTIPINTWTHVAAVRNGTGSNNVRIYINGVQQAQGTQASSINPTQIAINDATTYPFDGYFSNLRFVSGVALYRSNFTPLPLPLANVVPSVYASALLLGSGTDGQTTFTDSSIYNATITRIGSPVISTASFPTGMSSSIYFPSGASYLRTPHNANLFNFAADFTIEFWINYSAHDNFGGIFAAGGTGVWSGLQVQFDGTSDRITVQGNYATLFTPSTTLPRNTWNHVALSRVSGVMRLFFNGTQVGSLNNTASFSNSGSFVYFGSERSPGLGITGYLSNIRVFNTQGLYSANFTPSTLPLQNQFLGGTTITNNIYGMYQNF